MNASAHDNKNGKTRGRIKRAIARTAPSLARALGGPLAGAAVEQLSRAIFGDAAVDEEALADALAAATPEQLLAIKKAEQDFQLALRRAGIEELRIDAADRASARERQIKMNDWTPSVLGAFVILGFFAVLGFMVAKKLPAGAETEFSIMLGALATMTAAVVNYFFGSSAGSREKTRLIAFPVPEHKGASSGDGDKN
ncbi:MAG: hypothetical protein CMI63_12620 [Parvularcula sp.]|nr:hypothetical protein [Parvularcula sp.]